MADYRTQQMRNYGRPSDYGPASSHQRDAAFSNIFGAVPPPGRSQTMTAQSSEFMSDGRAGTMPSRLAEQTPMRPPPQRQPSGPLQAPRNNGYQIPNGTGHYGPPAQMMHQPQPQHLPQPMYPDRRPYPPQRLDPRPPVNGPPQFNRMMPSREPPQALNSNAYRTQSLATTPRPQPFQGGPGGPPPAYKVPPAHLFRQQAYQNPARTTAQGRIVPERHDERSMSMTSFARDSDYSQTMSGRVIPNRRRESATTQQDGGGQDPRYSIDSNASSQTMVANGHSQATSPQESQPNSRTMSMASTISPSERTESMTNRHRPSISKGSGSQSGSQANFPRRKTPLVYPALLSKVALAFRERIGISDKEKDGLVYKSAFTGSEAVDLIAYIMQTTDRNLALLLGRSLDAQKFFHDVTYDHRLRDSPSEVYQFRETLVEEGAEVNGVFTLTTECYSPTCTPDRLCYSIACPKRIDQQKRLNMKPQSGLKREDSRASLHEDQTDEQKLWINTVSKEVSDSISEREKKRQEVISEIMYTERDFVKDLEYLRDFWMKPLRSFNPAKPSPIPEHRRDKFIQTVFSNCLEVYAVNARFAEALTKRQQQEPVVRNVGDIFLEFVPRFTPFITYGANQLFGKYEYEKEKQTNVGFARFADETEKLKESRKLELNGYLTKPTTRLARYPLLLDNVLKYTEDSNPDKQDIPRAVTQIKEVLSRVNEETGKSENHFTLMQLSQQLVWKSGEYIDLKLTEESRQMLFKGSLKKSPTDSSNDIMAYLFDNALLLVRAKTVNKREELKVYKKPIPLQLLVITQMDEVIPRMGIAKRPSSSLIPGARANANATPKQDATKQQGFPITFKHLGKGGFEQTLFCLSQIQREKWMKIVDQQQKTLKDRSNIFEKTILNEGFFNTMGMKINCCVPLDGGRKLVVGTDVGIYLTDRKPKDSSVKPKRVIDCKNVTQVDVLEQHAILLVLSDKTLYSYSTDALDPEEGLLAQSKRGRKISHCSFFKIGVFDAQHLVCCVKPSALSTTIKVFRPNDSMTSSKKRSGLTKFMSTSQEVLKADKEFYIPSEAYSIHFLRSSLCVGHAKGFEIVTLDTLVTQPLLDQADTSLDFVAMKENLRPIHVERMNMNFLLCYSDFSFFVNKHGWKAFPDWMITWEGTPQAFAIFQPYILAFEPSFIEMRNLDTGTLVYILTAKNIRLLHSSNREILYAYEDEMGEDVIACLDFWTHS